MGRQHSHRRAPILCLTAHYCFRCESRHCRLFDLQLLFAADAAKAFPSLDNQ
jgi:hypothetical protein